MASPKRLRDIIAIGASAGGPEALMRLVQDLPRDLPAALFVVLHIGARRSELPSVLGAMSALPCAWAEDGEPVLTGRIYVAPPDRHLRLVPGHMCVSHGPRENSTRPAVDPLFRSAARAYGSRVIGVVLTGTLSDGTAGLLEIKRHGGLAVVQTPDDAKFAGMPLSAIRHVATDYVVPLATMGRTLARLATAPALTPLEFGTTPGKEEDVTGGYHLDPPAALTCPLCGGSLRETDEQGMPYFSCHVGHRFAAGDMDEAQFRQMESALEVALRSLNERAALCARMAETSRQAGRHHSAQRWEEAQLEADERARILRNFVEKNWLRPDPETEEA